MYFDKLFVFNHIFIDIQLKNLIIFSQIITKIFQNL